jgi:murein DD-endopeptidase MepM/ murein hydrolase activator NlpD
MPKIAALLGVMLLAPAVWADGAEDWTVIEQRLSTRQQILQGQTAQAQQRLREQAMAAYRLQRRRELGFFSTPESRVTDAQSSDMAITGLQRRHLESRSLSAELSRVQADLRSFEAARAAQQDLDRPVGASPKFLRPVRGVVVGEPGTRNETPTSTEIRRDGMEFLARLNEPVRAVGAGVVRMVEPLPQGGYSVITQHPMGWISILSGLRDVSVRVGDPVAQGQTVGLSGRNLDGAAVVSLELWLHRRPVDPRGRLTTVAKVL